MIISGILPYGKTKSRVLTDGDLVFSLYRSEIRRYALKPGSVLTDAFLETELYPLLRRRARERVLRLLQARDYPEGELRRKLEQGYCPPEIAEETVRWVRELHYVDDSRYAGQYVMWHSKGHQNHQHPLNKSLPRWMLSWTGTWNF